MNDAAFALACEGIGKTLNRALEYDPETPQKLRQLAGKSLLIESTAPRFCVSLLFTESQLIIVPSDECAATCMLSGTTPALIRLLLAGNIEAAETCEVTISDDDALIPPLLILSRDINVDWEALLAEHTGDVAAHLLGKSLRKAQQFQQGMFTRSKNGWATYQTDSHDDNIKASGANKAQSPLDFIGAQLKTLLP